MPPNDQPPVAKRIETAATLHGITRADPYAWLKDPQWQDVMVRPEVLDPDIRSYLDAENAYCDSRLAPHDGLKQTLFAELKARIKEDDSSVPNPDGPYSYYRRFAVGGQYPIICRCPREGEGEEILLDANREAEGHDFYKLASAVHSPDHKWLAYAVDLAGSEYHQVRFKDLATGALSAEHLENAQGGVVWANDGRTVFYTVLDAQHRPTKVYRHRVGDDPARDALVYEEQDPGFFLGVGQTESRRFILISAHDHTTSEVRLIDADAPEAAPRLVAAREAGVEYEVSHHGGDLLILTNAGDAVDFKIVTAPLDRPGRDHWQDLLPHEAGRLILHLEVFQDFLVRLERVQGLPRIVIRALADDREHAIAFDEEAYDLGISSGYEFDTPTLRFTYSSMTTPLRVYDYDMAGRGRVLRKEQEVPSGHDPADYVTRRIMAASHDGTRVPVSLLYRKDTPLDGSAPLLLYGYGSYGMSMPAGFATNRLSLVDRGFIYAIAHIRGGTDLGYGWYLDGKLDKKMNTFLDFVAAAEALVAGNYTAAGRIAAHGGSAGGMLMGVAANLRPDLFKAIVADVPFVDVLNTMCDAELPLTPPEWPEWGNPIEDAAAYDDIAAYSPYDNVTAQDYPNILATAGLTDPRVTYWEPAKWVAKLRALKTDDNLLLLKTYMSEGHAGAAGRFDKLQEVALVYCFLLKVFGLTE